MRKRTMRNAWIGIVALLLLFGGLNLAPWSDVAGEQGKIIKPMYTPHAPCRINNNTDFASSPCKTGGSGTQNDPYLIEGWDINGTGFGYALYIGNTSKFFIVRNNYLHHTSGIDASYFWNDGLDFYNILNNSIENNEIIGNKNSGIFLWESNDNNIANNTAANNGHDGITMYRNSNNNDIRSNNVSNNGQSGIRIINSNNNEIKGNTVLNNVMNIIVTGIDIYGDDNEIKNNEVRGNGFGIVLALSKNNKVIANNVSHNGAGIDLISNETNDEVIDNRVMDNDYQGIGIEFSSYNNIINNSISNNHEGFLIYWSNYNNITNNKIINNKVSGINISESSMFSNIYNNIFLNNNGTGKQALDGSGNNSWNSTIKGNYWSDYHIPSQGCYDNDTNGFCDNPYLIDGGKDAKDNYPFADKYIPPPRIISTSPPNGAKDIATTSKISITFSKEMDRNSVESAIKISPGVISKREWNNSGTNITLTVALEFDTSYVTTVSTDAKDLTGNPMASPYTFNFTTKGAPADNEVASMTLYVVALVVLAVVLLFALMLLLRRRTESYKETKAETLDDKKEEATKEKEASTKIEKRRIAGKKKAMENIRKRRESAEKQSER